MKKLFLLPLFALIFIFGLSSTALAAPGDLDPSFGVGGKVITSFSNPGHSLARSMIIQPDEKIVAAGEAANPSQDFALARYNSDGSLDLTFGNQGQVLTDLGGDSDQSNSLIIQTDGKLVAGGRVYSSFTTEDSDFALVRYNPDGSLDSSFGTAGTVITDFFGFNDEIYAMQQQTDGKIIAAGYVSTNNSNRIFNLVRYNSDGSLDTSFGTNGKTTFSIGTGHQLVQSLAFQPDGKIIAVGTASNISGQLVFSMARLTSNGNLDTSFGDNGVVVSNILGSVTDSQLQPDGKIIIVGGGSKFIVSRFNSDGSLDSGFGNNGVTYTEFGGQLEGADGIALRADGAMFVGGYNWSPTQNAPEFALAQFDSYGNLDLSFGTGGKVTTEFVGSRSAIRGIAIQTDGNVTVAGFQRSLSNSNSTFALARYIVDENTPPTANSGLDQTTNEAGQVDFDGSASTDPDGIADITTYYWDFGDGSNGSGVITSHIYDDNGIFNASLTVTDSAGETSTDSMVITVNNVAPVVDFTASATTIIQGESVTFDFSNAFDPSNVDTIAGFVYSVDCGVGLECSFPTAGTHFVAGTITDKDGGYSNYFITITVQTPSEAINNLVDTVTGFNLQNGIENSLDQKLETAQNALDDLNQNNDQAAINSLNAFVNAVEAQRGNQITSAQADVLISEAQRIIDSLPV